MKRLHLVVMLASVFAASLAGCNCGHAVVTPGDDGGTVDDGGTTPGMDAGPDAGPATDAGAITDGGSTTQNDGGPGALCLAPGVACSTAAGTGVCCSGVCNNGACTEAAFCTPAGGACGGNTDCCTNHCAAGACSVQQCLDVGQSCTQGSDCCTDTCGVDGKCAGIPGNPNSCKVIGQACTTGANCCSTNCQGGVCVRAFSCQAYFDVCQSDADCCSGQCTKQSGAAAGTCTKTTGAGSCTETGNPCTPGGNDCCTQLCLDQGAGVPVCQPVGGCRVSGDYCSDNTACCGFNTSNNVTCDSAADRCGNGNACNAPGIVCGKPTTWDGGTLPGSAQFAVGPDGGQISFPYTTNCCDGNKVTGNKELTCRIDRAGVPRCFGGGSITGCPAGYTGEPGCCIDTGNLCQFRDQCCNGALCLPGSDGGVQCVPPSACAVVGATCDPAASTCCSGTQCRRVDELSYACVGSTGSGGGSTDGGVDGGFTCTSNGGSCSAGSSCCSGICTSGTCSAPAQCQPSGGVCSAAADCCAGTTCVFGTGSSNGTCQTASTCSGIGQACTSGATCCAGLGCMDSTGSVCNGTTACSCDVAIQ